MLTRLVLTALPHVPRPLMRRFARRYIAGETLPEALERLEGLAERGFPGILDILGEAVTTEAGARAAAQAYAEAAPALRELRFDCYLSVKPTHVGLLLGETLAHELYDMLARRAQQHDLFLRVEMEDHPTTDATLRLFERLRRDHANVGIVLQSRLLRTPQDIERLAPGPLDVRLVKGIYLEPAAIAHVDPEPIREAYVACVRKLAARGARVALATHDEPLAARCVEVLRQAGRADAEIELQVLLGVREELWQRWRERGHRVRVYVPYGPDWRAYSLRRMRKNPEVLGHVLRNLVRPA